MIASSKEILAYDTWYDFKKELQRRSGLVVLNKLWLQIKPQSPLPWYEFHMKEALSLLSNKIRRLVTCPRCDGNLVLDRDIDGQFKRCIQCSFSIEITPPTIAHIPNFQRNPSNWKPVIKAPSFKVQEISR